MIRVTSRYGPVVLLCMLAGTPVLGSQLSLSYEALERNIATQLMTQDGRYYMQGDPSTPCAYAFVQDPRVDAVEGRLRIRLLFSGAAATSVGGRCVGAGDTFDIEITGVPTYANGELYLDQMRVQATAVYFRAVSSFVEGRLSQDLRFPLRQELEAAALWMSSSGHGQVQMADFTVHDIAVEQEALRFVYELSATIR